MDEPFLRDGSDDDAPLLRNSALGTTGSDDDAPLLRNSALGTTGSDAGSHNSAFDTPKDRAGGPRRVVARKRVILGAVLLLAAGAAVLTWLELRATSDGGGADRVSWPQKSMTFTNGKYCPEVNYSSPLSDVSMANIAVLGANYVSLIVTLWQANVNSTTVVQAATTATDAELLHAIDAAHSLGLQVMLKPQVDLSDNPGFWRGDIGMDSDAEAWDAWFASYGDWVIKYAAMANATGVEQFSIGCELISASPQAAHWRALAADVRGVYGGIVTYSANWGGEETNVTWWDAMDVIGVDAYYPLTPYVALPTVAELVAAWKEVIENGVRDGYNGQYMTGGLRNLTTFWDRPLVFTEVGYCSTYNGTYVSTTQCVAVDGVLPPVFMPTQTRRYQAVFEAFRDEEWFWGTHWWNWATDPRFGGDDNTCCTPQDKPAMGVVQSWYGGSGEVEVPAGEAACPCIL